MDKNKKSNVWGIVLLSALMLIYVSPLLINCQKAFTLFPKNIPRYYSNYLDGLNIRQNILDQHHFPLRGSDFGGGCFAFAHPVTLLPSPFAIMTLLFDEVTTVNLLWALFYIFGALSMFYLTRHVLKYNVWGAIFSSIVFGMNGHFAYLHMDGLSHVRSTLLLPLLFAWFLKAKENKVYIVLTALLLALMSFDSALFIPVIVLFIFIFLLTESFAIENKKITFDKTGLKIFFTACILAFLLASIKMLPVLDSFGLDARSAISSVHSYSEYIDGPNTLRNFFAHFFIAQSFGSGTMYIGYIPVMLCVLSFAVYFFEKRIRAMFLCLLLGIWFSFGPNAFFDLHKMLWRLPVFHEIQEISKYYGLFTLLFISIISGKIFSFFDRYKKKCIINTFSCLLVFGVFLNLLLSNIGYFNAFNTQLPPSKTRAHEFFQVIPLNFHSGNESIADPLNYFFKKENIGFVHSYNKFSRKTNIIPKYFLLPRYAFLMPYTSLLVLPNPNYKGEAFFLNDASQASIIKFNHHELVISVKTNAPDILVINQIYDKYWKTNLGKIENSNGLLSVKIDEAIDSKIHLRFHPDIFFIGVIISSIAFLGSMIYLFNNRALLNR